MFCLPFTLIIQQRKSHLVTTLGPSSGSLALGRRGPAVFTAHGCSCSTALSPYCCRDVRHDGWCCCHPVPCSFTLLCWCMWVSGNNFALAKIENISQLCLGLGSPNANLNSILWTISWTCPRVQESYRASRITILFTRNHGPQLLNLQHRSIEK